jgi:hypothetical protein
MDGSKETDERIRRESGNGELVVVDSEHKWFDGGGTRGIRWSVDLMSTYLGIPIISRRYCSAGKDRDRAACTECCNKNERELSVVLHPSLLSVY